LRKAPTSSGRRVEIGTIEIGNDGNLWERVQVRGETNKWSKWKKMPDDFQGSDFKSLVERNRAKGLAVKTTSTFWRRQKKRNQKLI
tara:strand:- start:95 stop:352 length:258 start_codon:yes stop_codon:yes gene_type:complete